MVRRLPPTPQEDAIILFLAAFLLEAVDDSAQRIFWEQTAFRHMMDAMSDNPVSG